MNAGQREPKAALFGGYIGAYGLGQWWLDSFSDEDRARMSGSDFIPLGHPAGLDIGVCSIVSRPACWFLVDLGDFFQKLETRSISLRCWAKAVDLMENQGLDDVMKAHFFGVRIAKYAGAWFLDFPEWISLVECVCVQTVGFSKVVAKDMRNRYGGSLPQNPCFEQLANIRWHQDRCDEAMELLRRASRERWNGDWGEQLRYMRRSLQKKSPPISQRVEFGKK